jgi:hypothetical protein
LELLARLPAVNSVLALRMLLPMLLRCAGTASNMKLLPSLPLRMHIVGAVLYARSAAATSHAAAAADAPDVLRKTFAGLLLLPPLPPPATAAKTGST